MRTSRRRRNAVLITFGLLAGVVPVLLGTTPASAGTQSNVNACKSNATGTYSDLPWSLGGEGTPDPITLGTGDITLGGSTVGVNIPADLLVAGYNLGFLVVGSNVVPTDLWVARQATNVDTDPGAGVTAGTLTKIDQLAATASTTITDPNGIPGTGDESATPLSVTEPLPDWVVTPTGGNVVFSQGAPGSLPPIPGIPAPPEGSLFALAQVGPGGLIKASFDCQPGTTVPGTTPPGTSFTPAASVAPFETVTVDAPPAAPVCLDQSTSVGAGQSVPINITFGAPGSGATCTDINGNIDGDSFTHSALTPALTGGTLTDGVTPGSLTYEAPDDDPGVPVTFTFSVSDETADGTTCNEGGLTEQIANGGGGCRSLDYTVTITVLANQCEATTVPCSLTQIIVLPVTGAAMTFDKAEGNVFMSPITLNGQPQVSTGALKELTITNRRGTAAEWNVTGYVTDLGNASSPMVVVGPGVTIPACSDAGSIGGVLTTAGGQPGNIPDRNCIPGDNLGWNPTAVVSHTRIAGDVADVNPGVADATSAADWLAQLTTAGAGAAPTNTPAPTVLGPDGLGGLPLPGQAQRNLCGAPVNQSGGTFKCNAALYLGVPASAGAGFYSGGLVLTLL